MELRKKVLAAAFVAGLAMGVTGQASASVYAGSQLDISNLVLTFNDQNNVPVVGINPNFTFNVEADASLKGSSSPVMSGDCGGSVAVNNCGMAPVLQTMAANAPGSQLTRDDNDYTLGGQQFDKSYANANAAIVDAQLVSFFPTSISMVAEAELVGAGQAQANTDIQSNTTFNLQFTVAPGEERYLDISFTAALFQQANVTLMPPNTSGSASTAVDVQFNLTRAGGGSVLWLPGITAVCTGGLSCSNLSGTDLLAVNSAVAGPVDSNTTNSFTDNYTLRIALAPGDYNLFGKAGLSANVSQIPEPGTLLLIGFGLLGLGVMAMRRRSDVSNMA